MLRMRQVRQKLPVAFALPSVMKPLVKEMLANKCLSMPILSYPATQLRGCSVLELVTSSDKQAEGIKAVLDRCTMSVALNIMDLSIEAEAFGAQIKLEKSEIPTVTHGILNNLSQAASVSVPEIGKGRGQVYIDALIKAKRLTDKPIFCGVIGPYSLAGRLYDMTELMIACYDQPENVEILLEKCASFIAAYIAALKKAGASGVIMAEPAAGLLSPALCQQFSSKYVKTIIKDTQDKNFVFVYHNCGNVIPLLGGILELGADIYHFGNAVDMAQVLERAPSDKVIAGNLNPIDFCMENKQTVYQNTLKLLEQCAHYNNYLISSGCDIPPNSNWDAIDGYFQAIQDFYQDKK